MSKKSRKCFEELRDWLPNMDREQIDGIMSVVGGMLAPLPGGDEFEDLGYEPVEGIGWHEFQLVTDALQSIENSDDVEEAARILFEDEEDDDE